MNSQSFQNIPTEMGLFTFYKQQQQYEQSRRKPQEKRKKKNRKHSKKKFRYYDLQRSLSKSKQKLPKASSGFKSTQFAKNRYVKNQLKSHLSKIQEKPINASQEEFTIMEVQKQQKRKFSSFSKGKTSPQIAPIKKYQLPLNSPQAEPISANIIRKTYFNKNHENKRQFAKERIRTQVNYNLQKNHFEYIESNEKQPITTHQSLQKQGKKQFIRTPMRSFKEKLQFLDTNNVPQIKNKAVDKKQYILINCNTSKELHQQNKRYFNNLIQNLHIQPQYNQTVYRILRQTLRLPELDKPTRHLKTEQSSPNVDKFKAKNNSHSLYKHTQQGSIPNLRERQNSLKQRTFMRFSVKGKVLEQPK